MWARTVITALSISIPCFAQGTRYPLFGMVHPRSDLSSLYMLTSDGGVETPGFTEKHSPWA